jgi:hypothetical protein
MSVTLLFFQYNLERKKIHNIFEFTKKLIKVKFIIIYDK